MGASKRGFLIALFTAVVAAALGAGVGLRVVSSRFHTTPGQLVFQRPFGGKRMVTIVVLGEDDTHSSNPDVRARTDTILVGSIDLQNKRVSGVSIPRDSRVELPGKEGFYKINSAYTHGGPELTCQVVANLLGIPVDYYVKTNIEGLKKVVDIVGGVEIDVEKDMHYVDRHGGLYINLKKGYRHLDGERALGYVRFRHDAMGDLWRVQRQQKFMRALARRLTAPENWTKLPQAMDEIMKCVQTNMTAKDLLTLARLGKYIPPEQFRMETLPGTPGRIGRASFFLPDTEAIPAFVDQMLKFQGPKPAVTVLNGSGTAGAADSVADVLRAAGYRISRTGNADNFRYAQTVVQAKDPNGPEAKAIAAVLNCTPSAMKPGIAAGDAAIVIIVGHDR